MNRELLKNMYDEAKKENLHVSFNLNSLASRGLYSSSNSSISDRNFFQKECHEKADLDHKTEVDFDPNYLIIEVTRYIVRQAYARESLNTPVKCYHKHIIPYEQIIGMEVFNEEDFKRFR